MTRNREEIEETDDPIARLRRIRDASAKRFASTQALADYLSAKWSKKAGAKKSVAKAKRGAAGVRSRRKTAAIH